MHQPDHRPTATDNAAADDAVPGEAVPAYGAPVVYCGSLTVHHGRRWTFAGPCDLYCDRRDCGDDEPRYTLAGPVDEYGYRELLNHVRRTSFTGPAIEPPALENAVLGAAVLGAAVLDDAGIELLNQLDEDELLCAGPAPAGGDEVGIALDELPF